VETFYLEQGQPGVKSGLPDAAFISTAITVFVNVSGRFYLILHPSSAKLFVQAAGFVQLDSCVFTVAHRAKRPSSHAAKTITTAM